jgi:ribonuclease PH
MAAVSSSLFQTPPAAPVSPFSRRDGRSPSQLRPLSYEQSLLHRADGSVRFTQGNTTLIIAVYGPSLATAREERWDAAVLSFTFSSLSAASSSSSSSWLPSSSSSLSHHLQSTFAPIVLTALHPRQRISVHVQLVHDDGGLLACAVNGVMLALLDAGVQCREIIAAVELRVRREPSQPSKETLILDPSREETQVTAEAGQGSRAAEQLRRCADDLLLPL